MERQTNRISANLGSSYILLGHLIWLAVEVSGAQSKGPASDPTILLTARQFRSGLEAIIRTIFAVERAADYDPCSG